MTGPSVTLHDKFDLNKSPVLLNGTQALVRLMLMQKAFDRSAGRNTAGYVTGYRGSPLGAVDMQMARAAADLGASDITFQPGLNEDLAATAVWGTQQAELRGEGRFDGVFGLWYGKGPGVDRTGDVMRHANMAGTSRFGGVVMAMGDDHTGESSTTCHQSDWAMVDAYMPVLSPAGVQEILDFGLYGFALSRYAGLWAGLKLMKDTVEVTSVIEGRGRETPFIIPEFEMPPDGLNIRLGDHWIAQEARLHDYKRFAAEAFARANKIDRRVWGAAGARIGVVAAGKNWLDLNHALTMLGIDDAEALRLGLTTYKVGQSWPLDMVSFHDWAEGLDLIIVVEEKRKLIEVQVKEAIFDDRRGRRVFGWKDGAGNELFPTRFALNPVMIARKLGAILVDEGRGTDAVKAALAQLEAAELADNAEDIAARLPYFCAGCPHNSSTKLPQGDRAYAGIGCHFMVQWMDRETVGFTHMGGEGANWIGEAPFSTRDHVFQNMGDGTYNHSGLQAIRAALAAGTNITFKILYNDAVAMTGGQGNDGGLTADHIAREVLAMGVEKLALVYDPNEEVDLDSFPSGIDRHTRDNLMTVQEDYRNIKGVTVILYVQTCAAEKRRRRKRGAFPDPATRVFINPDICEGCGDCGVQSNCVAIVPLDTDLGRKRAIDQSSCNKDYSCLNGFCPSFVTLTGASLRKEASAVLDLPDLPQPVPPAIDGTYNIVTTGIGGTGVVTVGAVLAMAAHLEGKGVGMMEMAGLAQKGGAVHIHCRIAETPADISAIRLAAGEADALIGGDLVVSAGAKTLGLTTRGRTGAVVNSHEIMTGAFTRDRDFRLPNGRMNVALEARLGDGLHQLDASALARVLMGDTIYSNIIVLGAAWQRGLVPLTEASLLEAITLNGAAPQQNQRAFQIGRWAVVHPDQAAGLAGGDRRVAKADPTALIQTRIDHLTAYQGGRLARKYQKAVARAPDQTLRSAIARGYHKVLSYKDEYEVARLHLTSAAQAKQQFTGDFDMRFHLAPPVLSKTGADGRPVKRSFGAWVLYVFRILARLKALRGTPFDPFGYSAERRMERRLIRQYEHDLNRMLKAPPGARAAAVELAELPLTVLGFGPVKRENARRAAQRRKELLEILENGGAAVLQAAE